MNWLNQIQSFFAEPVKPEPVHAQVLSQWELAVVRRTLCDVIKNRSGVRLETDGSFTVISDTFRVLPEELREQLLYSQLKCLLPDNFPVSAIRITMVCPSERLHG